MSDPLTVDPEFAALCPALTNEERNLLEASLQADGCRDPIILWANNNDTIIDGHNRYAICTRFGIPFKTNAISLPTRSDVVQWMVTNQFARRNLSEEQKSYLRGKRYNAEKKEHGGERRSSSYHSDNLKKHRQIADEFNVSPTTVARDAVYAKAVDAIAENAGPEAKARILSGESKLKRKHVVAIAQLPAPKQKAAFEDAECGVFTGIPTKHHVPASPDFDSKIILDLAELQGQKFGTIYADPPWAYDNNGTRANVQDAYSATMSVDEVVAMPVQELAADDAHLHLWVTKDFIFEGKRVLEAWGFEYKSMFVWVKTQMGIGNYWRVSHELMLLGVRGDAKRFNKRDKKSWLEIPRGKHSAKPEQIRHIIEEVSPGPYLELFGRKEVRGWTVFGNQVERRLIPA